MPDAKITALTAISVIDPAVDPLPIVDVSDTAMAASGTTKKITINQLLGASGTATLASATITGDLTVDTSTLKVDSTNNRVGIGTASPSSILHISNTAAATRITITDDTTNGRSGYIESNYSDALVIGTTSGVRAIRFSPDNKVCHLIEPSGTFTWYDGLGGTRMTLNSTGLGVGASPANDKILSLGSMGILLSGATSDFSFRNSGGTAIQRLRYTDATGTLTIGSATGTAYPVELGGNTTTRAVTIDASSNVGVGVAPSYKFHSLVASGYSGAFRASTAAITGVLIGNTVADLIVGVDASGNGRVTADTSKYLGLGSNGINDRATLDSAGNFVVGIAAVATTATDGFLYVTGCAGTPTGTPTAKTGRVPIVVDTTNNKLYFYSGGSWVAAN